MTARTCIGIESRTHIGVIRAIPRHLAAIAFGLVMMFRLIICCFHQYVPATLSLLHASGITFDKLLL